MVNNIFALTGSLLMGLSYTSGLFELLIIGRLLIGINSGEYRKRGEIDFVESS